MSSTKDAGQNAVITTYANFRANEALKDRDFDLEEKDVKKRKLIEQKFDEFMNAIENCTDNYIRIENMGENAYVFFNVITNYASNETHLQAPITNELQARCGTWLNMIGTHVNNPEFSWQKEVKDYNYLVSD